MNDAKLKKVKLKGNESFNFREGWLRKGMRCVEECETLFSEEDVMERLGVGSKMVKSIRFWLQATKLCEEKYTNSGRSRAQYLTDDFGRIVFTYDPYFDDLFTLYLIHYQIITSTDLCIAWSLFFNEYEGQDFTRDDLINGCKILLDKKMEEGATYSESSLIDDCVSVLKMYMNEEIDSASSLLSNNGQNVHPEDSLSCPLTELGLLHKSTKNKNAYIKTGPSKNSLDKLAVFYVITDNLQKSGRTSVSIDDLLRSPGNIGRVFNLNRVTINEYLDQLRIAGYVTINRTAGLDMVYVDNIMNPKDILVNYYEKAQGK